MSRRFQELANSRRVERHVYSPQEAAALRAGKDSMLAKLGPVPAAASAKPATGKGGGELFSAVTDFVESRLEKLSSLVMRGFEQRDTVLRDAIKRLERLERIADDDAKAAKAVARLKGSRGT